MLFLLESFGVMDYTKWFLNVEPDLHTWNKSQLVMVNILYTIVIMCSRLMVLLSSTVFLMIFCLLDLCISDKRGFASFFLILILGAYEFRTPISS